MKGRVYLVGAGPGDPGLLTVKGLRCLQRADLVVYDYLADVALLEHAPGGADLICVGKHGGGQKTPQEHINRLLAEGAKAGRAVVRLKGGDPFIFGRGGEEAEFLASENIPFEVVPGVSAGTAVPAYAGIPLTHRDYSSSVAFLAGYEYGEKDEPAVHWDELARGVGTLVLFMTTRQLGRNMKRLIAGGLDPTTPVAVIRWGTKTSQETLVGTAATIGEIVAARNLQPPALAVVGRVVSLREKVRWFEDLPLFGRRIVVTRARSQASALASLLEEWGAEVPCFPTIEIATPESWAPLDAAIAEVGTFDWVIFTSVNGVRSFVARLDANQADLREMKGARIAAIGPETARAIRDLHVRVDVVPNDYRAEGVLAALGNVRGAKILLPRAAGAREILPRTLRDRGAEVREVIAYRSVRPAADPTPLRAALEAGKVDMVTFTSSSTVRHFVEMFPPGEAVRLLARTAVGCIGPITADTAAELGMRVAIQPDTYTIAAFAEAIRAHFCRGG